MSLIRSARVLFLLFLEFNWHTFWMGLFMSQFQYEMRPKLLTERLAWIPNLPVCSIRDPYSPLLLNGQPFWKSPQTKHKELFRVGVIGTRRPSRYGLMCVQELIESCKNLPIVWVSGGALGIDGECHFQCLKNHVPTEAWLVGPIAKPNPSSHKYLFNEMAEREGSGIVIPSELEPPIGHRPFASQWLTRNQWLSLGLSALIVIEAGIYSGTWATVKFSQHLGFPVFAFPGEIFSDASRGTNLMISTGYAKPVESVEFLIEELVALIFGSPYNNKRWMPGSVDPYLL